MEYKTTKGIFFNDFSLNDGQRKDDSQAVWDRRHSHQTGGTHRTSNRTRLINRINRLIGE